MEGKGTIKVKTNQGKIKYLDNVFFVPTLSHNLLSVGQLIDDGYSVIFDDGSCTIRDKKSGLIIVNVCMTQNKMFPLDVSNIERHVLITTQKNESSLWHLRYGHLNIKGLRLLSQKGMVFGLPKINTLDVCEGYIYGKQSRKPFPIGKAWRASNYLELIHADLCGPMNTKSFGGS